MLLKATTAYQEHGSLCYTGSVPFSVAIRTNRSFNLFRQLEALIDFLLYKCRQKWIQLDTFLIVQFQSGRTESVCEQVRLEFKRNRKTCNNVLLKYQQLSIHLITC